MNHKIKDVQTANIYKYLQVPNWPTARFATPKSPCGTHVQIKPCHVQNPALYKPSAHRGVDSAALKPISLSLVTGKHAHEFLNTLTYGSFESQGLHVPCICTSNVDLKPNAVKMLRVVRVIHFPLIFCIKFKISCLSYIVQRKSTGRKSTGRKNQRSVSRSNYNYGAWRDNSHEKRITANTSDYCS